MEAAPINSLILNTLANEIDKLVFTLKQTSLKEIYDILMHKYAWFDINTMLNDLQEIYKIRNDRLRNDKYKSFASCRIRRFCTYPKVNTKKTL